MLLQLFIDILVTRLVHNRYKLKMLIISSREFRENQKRYFDLADKDEQVIIQRGKDKAYLLTPITASDRYFADPSVKERLIASLAQADQGEITALAKVDINKLLGVELCVAINK